MHCQLIKTHYECIKVYQKIMSIMDLIMEKFTIVLKTVMNVLKIFSKFIIMIINIIKHGPDFTVQLHVESEPFLGARGLLCNLNLQSLLPNESEQENRRSKNALQLQHLQVKRSGPGLLHGFSVSLY
jgi:hypothetical protein